MTAAAPEGVVALLEPSRGDGGGTLIAEGTPEQVAKVAESYTGAYLAPMLGLEPA